LSSWSAHDWCGGVRVDDLLALERLVINTANSTYEIILVAPERAEVLVAAPSSRSSPGPPRRLLARRQLPETAERARRVPARTGYRARVHHYEPRQRRHDRLANRPFERHHVEMSRRWRFQRLAVAVVLVLACAAAAAQRPASEPPILILISFDGWRWDYIDRLPRRT
jgi:hypothetical protein